ncbi:hypothetical protein KIPB_012569 [Kipferlia bialata]|uniref:Uncharacterized protein n=1 Tax=Kipferlia bialata TaxID=797122 RepID=A0A9K3D9V7_9EUKA|nr:hypothetical protein KIPB_012569 [Kipferlia bialata]|eukprot:g12569.t1
MADDIFKLTPCADADNDVSPAPLNPKSPSPSISPSPTSGVPDTGSGISSSVDTADSTASADSTRMLYHYTTTDAALEIMESGTINPSTDTVGDAAYGVGVYTTGLPPTTEADTLITNNWDGLSRDMESRVEAAIG